MIQSLKEVYLKNLNSLMTEISLYNSEEDIWKVEPGILNSAGNLTLHLMGNLNFFIGTYLSFHSGRSSVEVLEYLYQKILCRGRAHNLYHLNMFQ